MPGNRDERVGDVAGPSSPTEFTHGARTGLVLRLDDGLVVCGCCPSWLVSAAYAATSAPFSEYRPSTGTGWRRMSSTGQWEFTASTSRRTCSSEAGLWMSTV
jgi:hypothetical protein